jgi:hypothetical protein
MMVNVKEHLLAVQATAQQGVYVCVHCLRVHA